MILHPMRSCLFFLGVLSTVALSAQYQFGVQAGPQYMMVRGVIDSDIPGLEFPKREGMGYQFGAWYRSDRSHLIQVRLGLTWSYRTMSYTDGWTELGVDSVTYSTFAGTSYARLNYLELPVTARYYFWRGAHAELGIYLGRRIFGNIRSEGQVTNHYADGTTFRPDPYTGTEKDLSALARWEFGNRIAVGYDLVNGFCLGLSYQMAITRMEEAKTLAMSYPSFLRAEIGYDFLKPKGKRKVYHGRRLY